MLQRHPRGGLGLTGVAQLGNRQQGTHLTAICLDQILQRTGVPCIEKPFRVQDLLAADALMTYAFEAAADAGAEAVASLAAAYGPARFARLLETHDAVWDERPRHEG